MSGPHESPSPASGSEIGERGIRSLHLTDADLAAALHATCFEDEPWKAGAFTDLLAIPGTFGFLAHGDRDPLGLLLCRAVAEDCEVLTLAVVPSGRRAGVGRDLLRAGFARALELGAQTFFLEVAVDNVPAIGLYRDLGFTQTAVRAGYYRRKDPLRRVDAVVMSRPL